MKVHVVEIVESIFEVKGNPTWEQAQAIVKARLEQESTLDLVTRERTIKTCEELDKKEAGDDTAKDHRVRTSTTKGKRHSGDVSGG